MPNLERSNTFMGYGTTHLTLQECPDFLCAPSYVGFRNGPRMHLGIVTDWRAWYRGLYSAFYEPIMDCVNFDVFI